jgi:ABC-type transport system involved in multi-copper enzyme maturation permease subunit
MVVLPVVERELRVAARGRAIYRVRFWAVLALLSVFIWFLKTSGIDQNSSRFGLEAISVLLVPAFVFSLFIGVLATADCVSSEKREGTLGLLFLTDLKGYDVICGKLAANSLNAIYGLLAILPVLGLPVLLGGVTFTQFAKLAVVLLSTMILSLAAGIFVSTYSRNDRKAMFFIVLLLAAVTTLPFVLPVWWNSAVQTLAIGDAWKYFLFSPGYGILQTLHPPSGVYREFTFWLSISWQWLLAAALIAAASAHVPHSWEESGAKKKPRRQRATTTVRAKSRAAQGRAWLERNPFLWLAMQDEEASPRRVWMFVAFILGMWVVAGLIYGINLMADEEVVTMTMVALHVPLKIWIAAEAARRFSEDRNNHTFESLLSTPLSAGQIIQGQLLALLKQFAGPVGVVLVWETFMAMHKRTYGHWQDWGSIGCWPRMALLVADAGALAWVGMWLGLRCKGRIRAILGSLIVVLFIPWLMTQMIMAVLPNRALSIVLTNAWSQDDWKTIQIMATLGPSLLVDFAIMVWAVTRLPQNFRRLAIR